MGFDQGQLLRLQHFDTQIDQANSELKNLPEIEKLNSQKNQISQTSPKLESAKAELSAVLREQKRLEDEAETLEASIESYHAKSMSGEVTSSKELQDLGKAMESGRKKLSAVEDKILEAMEEAEPKSRLVEEMEADLSQLNEELEKTQASFESRSSAISARLKELEKERAETAQGIPDEMLTIYENLRSHHNGIGVAALKGDKCIGCDLNMTHPTGEVERLHLLPADEIAHCAECQRILVVISKPKASPSDKDSKNKEKASQ